MNELLDFFATKYNYIFTIILLLIGLHASMTKSNLVKKVMALSIFQTAVLLFYVSAGKIDDGDAVGTAPIMMHGAEWYDNPLPHTLMLTAIVVGVATVAVALSLIIRIHKDYGTIEENRIIEIDEKDND